MSYIHVTQCISQVNLLKMCERYRVHGCKQHTITSYFGVKPTQLFIWSVNADLICGHLLVTLGTVCTCTSAESCKMIGQKEMLW